MNQEKTIMVIATNGSSKENLKHLAFQSALMATRACLNNVQILDCIITSNGAKDIWKGLDLLKGSSKKAHTLLIYSPMEICKSKAEFNQFLDTTAEKYNLGVRWIKSTF